MLKPLFQKPSTRIFLRSALTFSAFLTALALAQFRGQIIAEELLFTSANFRAALYGGYFGLGVLILMTALSWSSRSGWILEQLARVNQYLSRLKGLSFALILVSLGLYLQLIYGFYGRFLTNAFPRLFLFWLVALLITTWLANRLGSSWLASLPGALVLLAVAHSVAGFFQQVNTYPLSLGWSEISRYYQASFFFSDQIYGQVLPWPVTHPSRYILQSIPFLLGELPLWAHRLWQAVLWVGMAFLAAAVLNRRLGIEAKYFGIAVASWLYLYLMQGAVFYHLLPAVILVLWGFDPRRLRRSLLIVMLASIWAGISRVNWVPLPGALAALLFLIETPMSAPFVSRKIDYWKEPITYFVTGTFTALASYYLYIASSGIEDSAQFGSSFTSALLWDRLWPTTDLPTGILPGILIVTLPLLFLIWQRLSPRPAALHWQRTLGIVSILAVFFVGGLVVSVKIGGGTNLHNMDAYMVLVLVLAGQLAFGRYAQEQESSKQKAYTLSWQLLGLILLIPILFAVLTNAPSKLPDQNDADQIVVHIQELVAESLEDGKEVLFISQRHLLTFKNVDAPLVHDYEKLFLMEMAISHNDAYLLGFEQDMQNKRFGLIITDPLHGNLRTENQDSLAAENNEWVRSVSRPILCHYESLITYSDFGVQILEPLGNSSCD